MPVIIPSNNCAWIELNYNEGKRAHTKTREENWCVLAFTTLTPLRIASQPTAMLSPPAGSV
jgi:hypothetical protein